ncbi:glycosyltransferase [uncultured Pseudodesulfovibrio sp.]|uniref:glycosyltransferase family protein n=1 Tax=uncultured Pseudodesulfovibrio sp. TaxID=2035858 RepID=UPI0029C68661|nr:glycosyltransferase [uncultured Pseudodesulfovibrio sp.]
MPPSSTSHAAPFGGRQKARVLLVTCRYFLIREIASALDRLRIPFAEVPLEDDPKAFTAALCEAVSAFRPTFLLTINRYGLDDTGMVLDILRKVGLPVVSWLVDSDTILLGGLAEPEEGICYATCDKAAVDRLAAMSDLPVLHLPLATDPDVFIPSAPPKGEHPWRSRVSFVGHSWADSVARNLQAYDYPSELLASLDLAVEAWERAPEIPFWDFLETFDPVLFEGGMALEPSRRKWFGALALWKAAGMRRVRAVSRLAPFSPLIVGDAHWDGVFKDVGGVRRLDSLDYDTELSRFYPLSEVVFNCTSPQMSMAVNQRAFDVPACGGFVVSERSPALEALFDIGTEAVCYDSEDDIVATIEECLANRFRRAAVTRAARKRILAEHTYVHRMRSLLDHLHLFGIAGSGGLIPEIGR